MGLFLVIIEGSGVTMPVRDGPALTGFATARLIMAPNAEKAGERARQAGRRAWDRYRKVMATAPEKGALEIEIRSCDPCPSLPGPAVILRELKRRARVAIGRPPKMTLFRESLPPDNPKPRKTQAG